MTLFIGGPVDGQERIVEPAWNSYSLVHQRFTYADYFHFSSEPLVRAETVYLKHKLGPNLEVFAIADMRPTDILRTLVDRYPRKL